MEKEINDYEISQTKRISKDGYDKLCQLDYQLENLKYLIEVQNSDNDNKHEINYDTCDTDANDNNMSEKSSSS